LEEINKQTEDVVADVDTKVDAEVENIDTVDTNIEEKEDVHNEEVSADTNEVVEEKTYTQADIDSLQAQVDELSQYKPEEKTEVERETETERLELWQERVDLTLEKEGLNIFAEFIRADVGDKESLSNQITKLKEIVGSLELSNGYQPSNHKSVDAFSIAKKNKDVNGMIREKLKF